MRAGRVLPVLAAIGIAAVMLPAVASAQGFPGACQDLIDGSGDPTNAGQLSQCLQALGAPESCADPLANYAISAAAQVESCVDGGGSVSGCVAGVPLFNDPGCFFGGAGSTLDQPSQTATEVFTDNVIVPAIPANVAGAFGGRRSSASTPSTGDAGSPVDPASPSSTSAGSTGRAGLSYNTVDASLTLDFWDFGGAEGTSYQIAGGYASVGSAGSFYLDGAYTHVDPDQGDGADTFRGKLGFSAGGDVFVMGLYGTVDYLDLEPDSILHGGAGAFTGLRFDTDVVKVSGGVVAQGVVSDRDLPDDEIDYSVSFTYGGGLGIPLGDMLALNGILYRTSTFGRLGDDAFDDQGSFTTLNVAADLALSPSFVLNAGYRTRFEIDDYDTNAFLLGVRTFWD